MANNSNLKFIKTLTIDQFKQFTGMEKIQQKQKTGSNKLYFTYQHPKWGFTHGPICLTEEGKIPSPAMVSLVQGDIDPQHPEREGKFWMIHKEGTPGGKYTVVGEW